MPLSLGSLGREVSKIVLFEFNFGGIHLGGERGRIFVVEGPTGTKA